MSSLKIYRKFSLTSAIFCGLFAVVSVYSQGNFKFNSLPFKDFANKYGAAILKKEIDINAPFKIEVAGKIDADGKIIDAKMMAASGSNPEMVEVGKDAIAAYSDSQLLKPLYDLIESRENSQQPKDIKILLSQDANGLQARIFTSSKSEADARQIQNSLNAFLQFAKMNRAGDANIDIIVNHILLTTQNKTFIINFSISNEEKMQLVEERLRRFGEQKQAVN